MGWALTKNFDLNEEMRVQNLSDSGTVLSSYARSPLLWSRWIRHDIILNMKGTITKPLCSSHQNTLALEWTETDFQAQLVFPFETPSFSFENRRNLFSVVVHFLSLSHLTFSGKPDYICKHYINTTQKVLNVRAFDLSSVTPLKKNYRCTSFHKNPKTFTSGTERRRRMQKRRSFQKKFPGVYWVYMHVFCV